MSLERTKKISTHDFGDIEVATLVSTASFNGGTVQFADDVSTILDIHEKALMVDGYSPCPWGVYQALNQEQPIEYDRTAEINALNQYVYWIWGGVTQGGVGLFKDIYGQLSFIISHGSCINNNNGKKRYWLVYGLSVGNYASRPSALQYHQFAMAYYNQAERKTNLITPFPNDNYSSYVAILIPSGNPTATNQEDPYRYWQLKFETVTVGSVTYDRPYYDPLPNNQNWFGSCNFTDFFDGTNQYYQSVVDNVREYLPNKIFACSTAYPWSTQYMCLDDEYYGLSGYTHEYGNWFGELADNDDEGGDGDGDDTQDPTPPQDVSQIPTNILDTGFFALYKPVSAELRGLANFMFAQLTDGDAEALKKLLVNPMDYITCLNCCHFAVPTGDHKEIKVGGIGTTVQSAVITNQFVTLDGGSYSINEYWGSYLDYAPYTKIQIHIPYCGTHDLDVDLVMSSTLYLKYQIDLLSGSMVAELSISKTNGLNNQPDAISNSVIEVYTGNVYSPIPIASSDYRNMLGSILGVTSNAVTSLVSGNPLPFANGVANAVTNSKTNVTKQGSISNAYGYISPQNAFLIISRPCLTMGETEKTKFHDWMGYPCNMVKTVGDFSGVLTIQKGTFWSGDNSNSFGSITDVEKDELQTIMEGGICV